jgi:hypothetical protein
MLREKHDVAKYFDVDVQQRRAPSGINSTEPGEEQYDVLGSE